MPTSLAGRSSHYRLAIWALAMGGFAIGTTEFVTMGLLPQISSGIGVSIPSGGHVISAYAVGVVVGAPLLAFAGARVPRRAMLLALVGAYAAFNALSATLRILFAVSEAYPQLQASRNFADLQSELSDTENRIAYARQYYNDAVLTYNTAVTTVPQSIFAAIFKFRTREYFQAGGEERGPVPVQF